MFCLPYPAYTEYCPPSQTSLSTWLTFRMEPLVGRGLKSQMGHVKSTSHIIHFYLFNRSDMNNKLVCSII